MLSLATIALLGACVPTLAPTVVLPTRVPTPVPSPTPTPAPTLTPTATPAPTLDPATVAGIVTEGQAALTAHSIEPLPLCLRWQDTDADGAGEWVGLYLRPGEPAELRAFVLDDQVLYDLLPQEESELGLGQYATCELEVRDVNADGRIEILVFGHAREHTDLLHIFAWDGAGYTLLGNFEGNAGVWLEDADGDLTEEVVTAWRVRNVDLAFITRHEKIAAG